MCEIHTDNLSVDCERCRKIERRQIRCSNSDL